MKHGIANEYLDKTVNPADDFYMFVNGGWMKTVNIPEDRSSWGSFHELAKSTDEKVLTILGEELSQPGPANNKAARLFETGMNLTQIEKARLSAISGVFNWIDTIKSVSDLPRLLGMLVPRGLSSIIHFSVHPDLGDSKKYAAYLEPASLGLPEREFYLEQDDKAKGIREQYLNYLRFILENELQHTPDNALQIANDIMEFETGLSLHMMPKEQRRQIELLYNPHSQEQLQSLTPHIEWNSFFGSLQIEPPKNIIVTEPKFFEYFNSLLDHLNLQFIKTYLTVMCVHHCAPYAHTALEEKHFDLFSKTLEGVEKMKPRKERIVKIVNAYLGEALGQLFVSRHFPASAKATALEMTDDIVTAFRNRISKLEWMSDGTKKYALEKLASFRVKIGYPDTWKDYSDLELSHSDNEASYLEDLLKVVKWKFDKDAKRIDSEVDKEEWFMAPQVVNAYYNPMFNEIVFPAAILQPPFFDWEADAAVNYGGIGAVIGHEITHGFDDQGSRFDKEGNLNEWWTGEDREKFRELTDKLVEQFDAYYPFEDLPLNGTFTLGENIADLGGLSVAYDALQLYYDRHGRPENIDGFTPEQRFFMSWATVCRTKTRPEALRTQIKTDPHPPGMYRAIAAPSNLDSFYSAFEIYPHSPWYRKEDQRIRIW